MFNTRRGISLANGFVQSPGTWLLSAARADAVVYCKQAGVPKGCGARPGAGVAPGVGAGAPGAGVAPGNRRGVR
jgi:hypothetical protein